MYPYFSNVLLIETNAVVNRKSIVFALGKDIQGCQMDLLVFYSCRISLLCKFLTEVHYEHLAFKRYLASAPRPEDVDPFAD